MKRLGEYALLIAAGMATAASGCGGAAKLRQVDLVEGTGQTAQVGDIVELHYKGWLASGKLFEDSHNRGQGQPLSFKLGVGQMIRGWDEGIPGMKVGGTRKLVIPPALAYGTSRQGNDIPANAELIFEIELLRIVPETAPPERNGSGLIADIDTPSPPHVTIEDIVAGSGPAAKTGDRVSVHYIGRLANGKVFDNSVVRKTPLLLKLGAGEVIKGWDEGLVGMKVGGKRKLTIPPDLAYGASGKGSIPPNATLTFEIELLAIPFSAPATVGAGELKIEDLKEGTGESARIGETVEVHYTGTLTSGLKFDSSVVRNTPFTFKLGAGSVIKGWDKGVPGMKVGGKRKLTIPPDLAYGARGRSPIPPNATLVFEIELLRIVK